MNIGKVKKALRANITHLPEKKANKIKDLLYQASLENPKKFELLVNKLAIKRFLKSQKDKAYLEFQQSPEYNKPYKWERSFPRKTDQ